MPNFFFVDHRRTFPRTQDPEHVNVPAHEKYDGSQLKKSIPGRLSP
jgi:hypothetical protein